MRNAAEMLQSIVGCKWSLGVLANVRAGVRRPGELERACAGISTKVLNERLRKLLDFGILRRESFPELPPRVEYHFTPFGERFLRLLDEVEALQRELEHAQVERAGGAASPAGDDRR